MFFIYQLTSSTAAETRSETKNSEKIDFSEIQRDFQDLNKRRNAPDIKGKTAVFLNDLSIFLIENGEWFLAGPVIEKAGTLCPEDSTDLRNYITITWASFQYLDGQLEEAETTYRQLYEATRTDTTQTDVHIRLAINLGEVAQQQGRKKEALEYFDRAMSIADSIGSSYLYINSAIHAERLEDNSKVGIEILSKCLEEAYQGNYHSLMAPAYLALARYHFRQNDYEAASQEIDKACATARKLGQSSYEAEGLRLWSEIYMRQNNNVMANACLQRLCSQTEHVIAESRNSVADHMDIITDTLAWSETLIEGKKKYSGALLASIGIGAIILIAATAFFLLRKHTRKTQNIQEEREKEELLTESLKRQIQDTTKELKKLEILYNGYGMIMTRIRQAVRTIKPDDQPSQTKLKELTSSILVNTLPDRHTPYVDAMQKEDEEFISRLEAKAGTAINPADRKLAIYLLHGLTTQEISAITGVLPKSVNQNRYRLRRALGLEQDEDLESYLESLDGEKKQEVDITTIDNQGIN